MATTSPKRETAAARSARPLKIFARPSSPAEAAFYGRERVDAAREHRAQPLAEGAAISHAAGSRPTGIKATPAHNLVFRGGKSIPALTYVNLYVAGDSAWNPADKQNIDTALRNAMTDPRLNAIVAQYFSGQTITTSTAPSVDLAIPAPAAVSRGDVDDLVAHALGAGLISGSLDTTIFNFLLPPGTVLTDDNPATGNVPAVAAGAAAAIREARRERERDGGIHPLAHAPEDKASSLQGLGGYHGSVHAANQRVYFAVGVFSQSIQDGENGIVAFDQSWKNVVATFYHELQEARTDADVEDAIRTNNDQLIGWNSNQGEEIGDFPVFEDPSLHRVFMEVPISAGGTAPVQLMYSNRVNGPELP